MNANNTWLRRLAPAVPAGWGVLFVLSAWTGAAAPPPFSSLKVFGDSLSDRGNVKDLTFGFAPKEPGYSDGRFTDGPLWVEHLSAGLGLGPVTPSRAGGTDYAYGNVTTGSGTTVLNPDGILKIRAPNIGKQVADYAAREDSLATDLFTMLGGGNDLFAVLDDGAMHTPQSVAGNIRDNLEALYQDGGRHILVANLPDIGKTPFYRGTGQEAQAGMLVADYNAALAKHLDDLSAAHNDLVIYRLDLFELINDVRADPMAYGLENVTDRAYTGDDEFAGNGTAVADPSKYLFWDAAHPSAAAHRIIGAEALSLIPEPSWAGAAAPAAALVALRRRRRPAA